MESNVGFAGRPNLSRDGAEGAEEEEVVEDEEAGGCRAVFIPAPPPPPNPDPDPFEALAFLLSFFFFFFVAFFASKTTNASRRYPFSPRVTPTPSKRLTTLKSTFKKDLTHVQMCNRRRSRERTFAPQRLEQRRGVMKKKNGKVLSFLFLLRNKRNEPKRTARALIFLGSSFFKKGPMPTTWGFFFVKLFSILVNVALNFSPGVCFDNGD